MIKDFYMIDPTGNGISQLSVPILRYCDFQIPKTRIFTGQ